MSMWRLFCSLPFFARVKKNIHAGRKGYLPCALASLREYFWRKFRLDRRNPQPLIKFV